MLSMPCSHYFFEQLIPANSIVLPVNNFGANYLQLSVCSKGVNAAKLDRFGQVGEAGRFGSSGFLCFQYHKLRHKRSLRWRLMPVPYIASTAIQQPTP